ncbi:MAG: SPFH domain-containing protein [Ignavibacteriae bacterium]|nr:SPFH domain-containing protein [Ignavibacteriota bacterium]
MQTIVEKTAKKLNGYVMLFFILSLTVFNIYWLVVMIQLKQPGMLIGFIPSVLVNLIALSGFFIVQPNEARVLVMFGKYVGSVRDAGFFFANPFVTKKHVSLRIHNFNSERIKVNDLHGNPIEIGAVVVYRVVDSARALFDVENYEQFVAIQSETAIRALASEYAYDSHEDDKASLRGNPTEIAEALTKQVQSRLQVAGVEIIEARISHLAYAQEIAQTMLRRQQAQAIIAARKKIVEGAVGMVQDALRMLSEQHIVTLDEDKKATMVNNLMVALVSDHEVQPVINTGTLYQ